jgi:hypothetical protein
MACASWGTSSFAGSGGGIGAGCPGGGVAVVCNLHQLGVDLLQIAPNGSGLFRKIRLRGGPNGTRTEGVRPRLKGRVRAEWLRFPLQRF